MQHGLSQKQRCVSSNINESVSDLPVLILAPVLKVLKHGVQLAVWIPLQVTVDADIAPVANLL